MTRRAEVYLQIKSNSRVIRDFHGIFGQRLSVGERSTSRFFEMFLSLNCAFHNLLQNFRSLRNFLRAPYVRANLFCALIFAGQIQNMCIFLNGPSKSDFLRCQTKSQKCWTMTIRKTTIVAKYRQSIVSIGAVQSALESRKVCCRIDILGWSISEK